MNLKDLAQLDPFPDVGQTFYVVDGNYRTQAQGWTRADGTGPLDLWAERNPGYVFGASGVGALGYANDAAAIQAAVDATIDFRGDKVHFTPGAYSIGTAITVDSAGIRLVGPPVRTPHRSAVTLTGTATNTLTVSVDDVEMGFLRMVPLTAGVMVSVSNGADYGYVHDVLYDAVGVAASTSTEFVNAAATTTDWLVERFTARVDAAQGDAFTWATATRWVVQDSKFYVIGSGIAWASVFTLGTACLGNVVGRCLFRGTGGATPAVFTNIFTGQTNSNGQLLAHDLIVDGTALATATAIETGFGTTTDIEIANCYQTGDATTEGGTLILLA